MDAPAPAVSLGFAALNIDLDGAIALTLIARSLPKRSS